MLEIIVKYHLLILGFLNSALWYHYVIRLENKSAINFILFPLRHFGNVIRVRDNASTFPIMYSFLLIFYGIAYQVKIDIYTDIYVYCIGFGILLVYESFAVLSYAFEIRRMKSAFALLAFIGLIISIAVYQTIDKLNYQILCRFDFYENLVIFTGASYIVYTICKKDLFVEELEAFFIFFGVILYSFMHILATILLIFDISKNFVFASNATLLTFIYWMSIIQWIRRLRSEFT